MRNVSESRGVGVFGSVFGFVESGGGCNAVVAFESIVSCRLVSSFVSRSVIGTCFRDGSRFDGDGEDVNFFGVKLRQREVFGIVGFVVAFDCLEDEIRVRAFECRARQRDCVVLIEGNARFSRRRRKAARLDCIIGIGVETRDFKLLTAALFDVINLRARFVIGGDNVPVCGSCFGVFGTFARNEIARLIAAHLVGEFAAGVCAACLDSCRRQRCSGRQTDRSRGCVCLRRNVNVFAVECTVSKREVQVLGRFVLVGGRVVSNGGFLDGDEIAPGAWSGCCFAALFRSRVADFRRQARDGVRDSRGRRVANDFGVAVSGEVSIISRRGVGVSARFVFVLNHRCGSFRVALFGIRACGQGRSELYGGCRAFLQRDSDVVRACLKRRQSIRVRERDGVNFARAVWRGSDVIADSFGFGFIVTVGQRVTFEREENGGRLICIVFGYGRGFRVNSETCRLVRGIVRIAVLCAACFCPGCGFGKRLMFGRNRKGAIFNRERRRAFCNKVGVVGDVSGGAEELNARDCAIFDFIAGDTRNRDCFFSAAGDSGTRVIRYRVGAVHHPARSCCRDCGSGGVCALVNRPIFSVGDACLGDFVVEREEIAFCVALVVVRLRDCNAGVSRAVENSITQRDGDGGSPPPRCFDGGDDGRRFESRVRVRVERGVRTRLAVVIQLDEFDGA